MFGRIALYSYIYNNDSHCVHNGSSSYVVYVATVSLSCLLSCMHTYIEVKGHICTYGWNAPNSEWLGQQNSMRLLRNMGL